MLASQQIPNKLMMVAVEHGNGNGYCGPVTIQECCILYYGILQVVNEYNWGGTTAVEYVYNQTVDAYYRIERILLNAIKEGNATEELLAEFKQWHECHEC